MKFKEMCLSVNATVIACSIFSGIVFSKGSYSTAFAYEGKDFQRIVSSPDIEPSFVKNFYNEELYKPLECGSNIYRFLELLTESGKDIRGLTVHVLLHRNHVAAGLPPTKVGIYFQTGRLKGYTLKPHVFLEHSGRIFDFDYFRRGESFVQYVKIMYKTPQDIDVVSIKAGIFVELYERFKNVNKLKAYIRSEAGHLYPLATLAEISRLELP